MTFVRNLWQNDSGSHFKGHPIYTFLGIFAFCLKFQKRDFYVFRAVAHVFSNNTLADRIGPATTKFVHFILLNIWASNEHKGKTGLRATVEAAAATRRHLR